MRGDLKLNKMRILMELKIRQKDTGVIYSSDMSDENEHYILSLNFCTSYTQAEVQDKVDGKFTTHDVILPPFETELSWIGSIATQNYPE
jgi:hypothetical protein